MTYGIQSYGDDTMGWTSPAVMGELSAGVAPLVAFLAVEARAAEPLRIRAFSAGMLATLLAAVAWPRRASTGCAPGPWRDPG